MLNRHAFKDNGTYAVLRELLRGKDYFVLTATTNHSFHRSGFDRSKIFCPQGDYDELRYPEGCEGTIIRARDAITRMCASQKGPKVPEDLIPAYPECRRHLVPHIGLDERFVQDDRWYDAARRFDDLWRCPVRHPVPGPQGRHSHV